MRLDADIVAKQIANLLVQYPELAEDEFLRADMIEGSTSAHEMLLLALQKHRDTEALIAGATYCLRELQQRIVRFERRSQAMRDLMFNTMMIADLKRLELPEATLSIRDGIPKVIITDESIIPDVLCRVKREPDKIKIKALLESGTNVQGAVLSNAQHTLAIRTK